MTWQLGEEVGLTFCEAVFTVEEVVGVGCFGFCFVSR